jgi:hypothetical protein
MKKVFSIIAILALTSTFVACGSSQADKDAAEAKRIADSTHVADSLAAVSAMETPAVIQNDSTATTPAPATETTEKK